MNNNYNDVAKVLIDKDTLAKRIEEMGKTITSDYAGKKVIMICILKGSSIFYADLVRNVDLDVAFEFMTISSYGNGSKSSGNVKILSDISVDIAGKNVIVVEDIIDSGNTLFNLKKLLLERNPESLKICTLLDKKERREVDMEADYVGFDIPDEFVIGYGLDYAQKYRNLPEVCVIAPSAIK